MRLPDPSEPQVPKVPPTLKSKKRAVFKKRKKSCLEMNISHFTWKGEHFKSIWEQWSLMQNSYLTTLVLQCLNVSRPPSLFRFSLPWVFPFLFTTTHPFFLLFSCGPHPPACPPTRLIFNSLLIIFPPSLSVWRKIWQWEGVEAQEKSRLN